MWRLQAQGTGIPAIRPKRSAVLPEKSDKARSGFSFGNRAHVPTGVAALCRKVLS